MARKRPKDEDTGDIYRLEKSAPKRRGPLLSPRLLAFLSALPAILFLVFALPYFLGAPPSEPPRRSIELRGADRPERRSSPPQVVIDQGDEDPKRDDPDAKRGARKRFITVEPPSRRPKPADDRADNGAAKLSYETQQRTQQRTSQEIRPETNAPRPKPYAAQNGIPAFELSEPAEPDNRVE